MAPNSHPAAQLSSGTVARVVQFLSDFRWFLSRWQPVSVKLNSPRLLWRMAMSRASIHAAIARSRAAIKAEAIAESD